MYKNPQTGSDCIARKLGIDLARKTGTAAEYFKKAQKNRNYSTLLQY
jgi:hypothetical protein